MKAWDADLDELRAELAALRSELVRVADAVGRPGRVRPLSPSGRVRAVLRAELSDGRERLAADLIELAREHTGASRRTIARAVRELGLLKRRRVVRTLRPGGRMRPLVRVTWRLPSSAGVRWDRLTLATREAPRSGPA